MNDRRRHELDHLIESVHHDPQSALEIVEAGPCDGDDRIFDGKEIAVVQDLPTLGWDSGRAHLLGEEVDPERLEELRSGDPPTSEEEELWQDIVAGSPSDSEGLHVYSAAHSQNPEMRIYAVSVMDGYQGTGWVGSATTVDPLLAFIEERVQGWERVALSGEFGGILDGLDEIDAAQAQKVIDAARKAAGDRVVEGLEQWD